MKPRFKKPKDTAEERARARLLAHFEDNADRVFYSRQLEILFEREYFHWVTNRAVRGLIAEGRILEQRVAYAALRLCVDPMHGVDEQVGERIGDRAAAQVRKGRKPREPLLLGVTAELTRRFNGDALPVHLELSGTRMVEELRRKLESADDLQLRHFVANAVDADAAGVVAQRIDDRARRRRFLVDVVRVGRLEQGVESRAGER